MNRYKNLDIDLLGYERDAEGEFVRARVHDSPVGEQRDADAERLAFPSHLRQRVLKLERRELQFDELILLGEELAALLLPPPVREFYRRSLDKLRTDEGLRIRIRPHDPALAILPWEYAYVQRPDVPPGRKGPEGFLALDRKLSLVRYELMGEPPVGIRPMEHRDIRTLAMFAEVQDPAYAKLDFDREELNLRQALEGCGGIDARFLRPGTANQLQEMLGSDAQVFHFSGHGELQQQMGEEPGTLESTGQLVFAGDGGRAEPVGAGELGVQLRGRGIRLIILNACEAAKRDPVTPWTGIAPALVRQGIPAVVGMQYTIRDGGAIAFSRHFYRALAAGESIDSAVSNGRLGILARSGGEDRDWGVPVLYMRSAPSVLFPPPLAPLRRNLALAVASIALLSSWFYLHIFPLVAEGANRLTARLGLGAGALTGLLALWKIIGTFAIRTVKSEKGSVLERWLRHRLAKPVLTTLLAASIVLFSMTSSVYLHEDRDVEDTIKLSLLTVDGLPFPPLRELQTSPSDGRLGGGPIFLFPPPGELRLKLDKPSGWRLVDDGSVRPRPWNTVSLQASRVIKEVELRVLRLVPGNTLINILRAGGQQAAATHVLRVKFGGKTYLVDPFRPGVVWLGGPRTMLWERVHRESESDRDLRLAKCLESQESVQEMKNLWNANIEVMETDFIKPDEDVVIEVVDLNQLHPGLSFNKTIPAAKLVTGEVDTECLEAH